MLIEFSMENFKSVGKRQTLFMQPARRVKGSDYVLETGIARESKTLPCAAILGANASGKSTIIEGLFFLKWLIQNSGERKKNSFFPDMRFKLNPEYLNKPTSFFISFIADNEYMYEYSISFFPEKIETEELTCIKNIKGSRKVELIYRDEDDTRLNKQIYHDAQILKFWKADINSQRTFLSYLSNKGDIDIFDPVILWFEKINGIDNEKFPHFITSSMVKSGSLKKDKVLRFLASADININNFEIEEDKVEIPSEIINLLTNVVGKQLEDNKELVSRNLENFEILNLKFEHIDINGMPIIFDFDDESDGTKHYYSIAGPVLNALEEGLTLLVDELDQSLHPFLLRKIVQLFTDKETNPRGAQLIFTTHDVTVLDRALLRPDEIYFTDKDKQSFQTELYSLAEFEGMGKNDRREKIYKEYLTGRFRAVPEVDWDYGF